MGDLFHQEERQAEAGPRCDVDQRVCAKARVRFEDDAPKPVDDPLPLAVAASPEAVQPLHL